MMKLQYKTDELALAIVKISNTHSVLFLKIQSRIKTASRFQET